MKGILITLEGGEGSGKTTIIKELANQLADKEFKFILTREPGGTPIAEQIRNILLDQNNKALDNDAEALLHTAARVQHYNELIKPNLEKGINVISDRYLDSSLVYQGIARGAGVWNILEQNLKANIQVPDITFFIDVDPEEAFKRIEINHRYLNRMDNEDMEFHRKVYEGYHEIAKDLFPERIKVIDGKRPVEDIVQDLIKYIDEYIKTSNELKEFDKRGSTDVNDSLLH